MEHALDILARFHPIGTPYFMRKILPRAEFRLRAIFFAFRYGLRVSLRYTRDEQGRNHAFPITVESSMIFNSNDPSYSSFNTRLLLARLRSLQIRLWQF